MEDKKLPEGWKWVNLQDVAVPYSGAWGQDTSFEGSTEVIVLGVGNVSNDGRIIINGVPTRHLRPNESDAIAEEGDLLVVKSSGSASNIRSGKAGLVTRELSKKVACSNFMIRLVIYRKLADSYLLWHILNSNYAKEFIKRIVGASTYPNIKWSNYKDFCFPLPPLTEQKRIAVILNEQMTAVEKARAAAEARLEAAKALPAAYIRESLTASLKKYQLTDCLVQVVKGVGSSWAEYPVLGATRAGLAPAKEGVGKAPERYKLVDEGTIFYNPMRILLGSIAFVDEGDKPGITSPDYVVFKGKKGVVNTRWFYYWFRSEYGKHFIKSMSRGAVRERMLFNRLGEAKIELPSWEAQQKAADRMKHIKALQTLIETELDEINALPSSLLRRAFNGEL
jgi:type I restriction enzyme S subunit